MKSWLRKLFYLDNPAQEAFFALTLWLVGSYVFFSLSVFAWAREFLFMLEFGLPLQVAILLLILVIFLLYFLVAMIHFFDRRTGKYHAVWGCFGGWCVLLVFLNILIPEINFSLNVIWIAVFGLLLPLACSGKYWKWALGMIAALLLGSGMVVFPFCYSRLFLLYRLRIDDMPPPPPAFALVVQRFFGIAGYGWTLWMAVGLLLLLIAYLCFAKLMAGIGNKSFRSMFDRAVVALLIAGGLIYLTSLGMAFFAKQEYAGELAVVERYFGHPVSITGLKQLCYGKMVGDRVYWERLEKLRDSIYDSPIGREYAFDDDLLAAMSPADRIRWRNQWQSVENPVRAFEVAFSSDIPLPEFDCRTGALGMKYAPHYLVCRNFMKTEFWRIRFSLMDGDIDAALAAYGRINRVNRFLLQDASPRGGTTWLSLTHYQLAALQLLLESSRLAEQDMLRLAGELENDEARAAGLRFRCLYGSTVEALDIFDMFAGGLWFEYFAYGQYVPFPLKTIRFFVPQFWYYSLSVQTAILRFFHASGSCRESRNQFSIFGLRCIPVPIAGTKFDETTARLRAMRGLIAAEVYKRKHGDYPDAMPDLPLDPFSGKPLLYRKGICPYRLTHVKWNPDPASKSGGSWQTETTDTEIPVIQVWSVGPDRVDSGGGIDRNGKADDVGAMLRLKP